MIAAAPGGGREQRLPRSWRITRSREIRSLFQRGKRSRMRHLDVYDSTSPAAFPRAGVVVPRYRHRIVERNRLKRRLREIVRRRILPGLRNAGEARDILVSARREAYQATYGELEAELVQWLERRVGAHGSSSP